MEDNPLLQVLKEKTAKYFEYTNNRIKEINTKIRHKLHELIRKIRHELTRINTNYVRVKKFYKLAQLKNVGWLN